MIVGYARTSTADQVAGFEAQHRMLQVAGCEKIFSEQVSSVKTRAELEQSLDFVREGDVFVVTKLDRLARSMTDLINIVERLERKGVVLRILDMNLDTSTPTGRLVLNVMGSIAEFERAIMLERQREGIAKARAANKFKGRKPTARSQSAEVYRMIDEGMRKDVIARHLGISLVSVYRILRERAKE